MAKLCLVILAALAAACGPSSATRPNPAYYLGETHLRRGQLELAVDSYKVFITDPGYNPDLYLPRAYYMLAFAYYRQEKYEDAMATLDELERRYPTMDAVQVWTLRGDVSRDLGNRVQALQEYDEAWRFAGPVDRIRLETRVQSTIKEMSVDELAQGERLVSDPVLHDLTAKQLVAAGGSVLDAEDLAASADDAAAVAAVPIVRSHERRAARLEAAEAGVGRDRDVEYGVLEENPPLAIEPEPAGPGKVLCLAPLSGPEADMGQQICDSVTSAFSGHSERVLTQDSGETENAARAAWMTAIEDPTVVGAIAWLPRESMQAVAPLVETAGVPLIALSGTAGFDGRYVRGWSLGRSQEVDALARYMVQNARMSRFGVLFPETASGNDYLDRFTAAVRAVGGEVVGQQFYRSGGGWAAVSETIRKWRARDVNVDAVFIPDHLADVRDMVVQINDNYPDLIVLGLSSWSGSDTPVRAFVASGTETAAYDAASALYGAIVGAGANTRTAVETRLNNLDLASAVSGSPPTILRLQGGTARPVGG